MRHAGQAALDELEPVLAELRKLDGLREKNRGTFYRGSTAFLHFHEDPAGMFADLKIGEDFQRFRVSSKREITAFLSKARNALRE